MKCEVFKGAFSHVTFGVGKNSSPLSGSGMSSKCVASSSLHNSGTTGGTTVPKKIGHSLNQKGQLG